MTSITDIDVEYIRKAAKGQGSCATGLAMLLHGNERFTDTNKMLEQDDPTAHAAIVITRSKHRLIRKDESVELLLSEKPCPMCICAISQTSISRLHYLNNNRIDFIELRPNNIDCWYEEIHTCQKSK